nr:hypothetical protein GCM10020093_090110 [Planobispora longispora]
MNIFEPATLGTLLSRAAVKRKLSSGTYLQGAVSLRTLYKVSPSFRDRLAGPPKEERPDRRRLPALAGPLEPGPPPVDHLEAARRQDAHGHGRAHPLHLLGIGRHPLAPAAGGHRRRGPGRRRLLPAPTLPVG